MSRRLHRLSLLVAVAIGLGALVAVARLGDDGADWSEVAQPAAAKPVRAASASRPSASDAAPAPVSGATSLVVERQRSIPRSDGELFAALSWLPPPPPPPRVQAPPPPPPVEPTAPALPFTFVGMVEQGAGKPRAFLAKGETLLVVASGDVIENNSYRVDSLSATAIRLTYLPLGKQQTLNVSGSVQ